MGSDTPILICRGMCHLLVSSTIYVHVLVLSFTCVQVMLIDLLIDYQVILRNWTVIKVVFQACHEACCEALSTKIWFASSNGRDIAGPSRVIRFGNAWPCD